MLTSLTLKNVGPAPELSLECAPRLNVLTGDNGLGKSLILDLAWFSLTSSWASFTALPRVSAETTEPRISAKYCGRMSYEGFEQTGTEQELSIMYQFDRVLQEWTNNHQGWSQVGGRSVASYTPHYLSMLNPVIYAKVDGSFSVWDPARNFQPVSGRMHVYGGGNNSVVPMPFNLDVQSLWNGLRQDSKIICNGLLADWVAWQNSTSMDHSAPFQILSKTLATLSPRGESLKPGKPRRIFVDDARDFPTLDLGYDNIPIIHASAGMKRIICLSYAIAWAWNEHIEACRLTRRLPASRILVLMDEVENHLHPKWQRRIVSSLVKALEDLHEGIQAQFLLTTHAPMVLTSLEPIFDVSRDALWHYELVDGNVQLQKAAWRRRGDANTWLISEIFDLDEPRSLEGEQAIGEAEGLMRRQNVQRDEFEKARYKLRATLPDIDPFFVEWRFWARQTGFEP